MTSFRINVVGSYRAMLRNELYRRHFYAPGSRFRKRLHNEARRCVQLVRSALAEQAMRDALKPRPRDER